MAGLFPIALKLAGRRCVVVGGGAVALRRVEALLEAEGSVAVVAPQVDPQVQQLADQGRIALDQRAYVPGDLTGALLVIAATDRSDVNAAVAADARSAGVLCCDSDQPDRGDFVVPAAVRRGDLLLTATTGGSSPALSARIRKELEARYGDEYAEMTAILRQAREAVLSSEPDPAARRRRLSALAEDDSLLELIRSGRSGEARERALRCISSPPA